MNQFHSTGCRAVGAAGLWLALMCWLTLSAGSALAAPSGPLLPEMLVVPGLEEPLVATGATSPQEDAALAAAIAAFENPATPSADFADSARPFTAFLAAHPGSAWRMAVLTNLGLGYYRAGYFTKASVAWEQAWTAGRAATSPDAKALTDRALGELVRMHARVGKANAIEALLADAGERAVSGPATELVTGAREGLWLFRNDWGRAYLCGPMALKNLLISLKSDPARAAAMDRVRSGPKGFTLEQVADLATQSGLQHRLIHRVAGEPIPVPSIVNWKVNHYAAIVGEEDGRYHIKDPTFGGDLWMTKAAIDAETSGYFLVPDTRPQRSWRTVAAAEARQVYGMGFTEENQLGATKPIDVCMQCPATTKAPLTVANAKTMLVSLNLSDTPVGYQPAKGPSAHITLTYNQREASQPAVFSFFNISPKWSLNVLSWVQDDPNQPTAGVVRHVAGGGSVDYSIGDYGYNPTTGARSPERQGQGVLVRNPPSGAARSYELRMPDGSKQIFAKADRATSAPRRMFLTRIVDAAGNAVDLTYDNRLRLTSLTDATGRNTTFLYENAARPLLVTKIVDPFGRSAVFSYNPNGRLASITDILGIVSSFGYDSAGQINTLITPYGTSRFSYGENTSENSRFLEMTDPLSQTERLEFRHIGTNVSETGPPGFSNEYLEYRNTFYWDKHIYPVTHGDYSQARITHWLHDPQGKTSPVIESTKNPLENRSWFAYPAQWVTYFEGSAATPITLARVLGGDTSQVQSYTYNSIGKPLTAVDPVGRKTFFKYQPGGIDLRTVEQQTGGGATRSVVASFTYNTQHLPLTHTDAAGQTTQYGYNAAGQLTMVTDALGQITQYVYDPFGRLTTIVNPSGATKLSRTYDGFDRVETSTDSEGYTFGYSYDAFDRVTEIRYPDGTKTKYAYKLLDLETVTDRLNRVTRYVYDANRQLTEVIDPLGQTTRYGYFKNGVLASITDPKGNITSWEMDIQSRPTVKRYADGTVERYAYDAVGRLKSTTDALGQVKSYRYANDDRPTRLTYTNTVKPTANVAFTYDAFFPRLKTMADGIGTTTFQYHPPGVAGALQLASEDGPFSNDTVAYQYDSLGRVQQRTVDSASESFGYDMLGRTTTHDSALGAFTRTYLGQTGQLASQMASTGVGTTWSYDTNANDRRLLGIGNTGQARSFGFATTPENRITGIAETIGGTPQRSWGYEYDALDRLKTAQPTPGTVYGYDYDPADNLTTVNGVTATHNAVNQIVTFGGVPFVYDANGNLIDDGQRTYQWDAENRLVGIGYKAQPGNATTMRYDGLGRRLAISETGTAPAETRYLWCGDSLCQARSAADAVTRRYFSEGVVQDSQRLYYGIDQLGSVRDLSIVQTGAKSSTFDYDPYGNTTAVNGVIIDFRYALLYFHGPSGLHLANSRAYDPRTARWIWRDPIAEEGGLNLYSYAAENPISLVDPDGRYAITLLFQARQAHYKRNLRNKEVSYETATSNQWITLSPFKSTLHRIGFGNENNVKLVSPDGHSEVVFRFTCGKPELVTENRNMGTYNFFGPDFMGGIPHAITDIIPYYIFGNTPGDMFKPDRFEATWNLVAQKMLPSHSNLLIPIP